MLTHHNPAQAHFVLPESLCEFRSRIDAALMDELIASQAAAAMDARLLSSTPLVIDTFLVEQDSQRVTNATTLYKAQKTLELLAHRQPLRSCTHEVSALSAP